MNTRSTVDSDGTERLNLRLVARHDLGNHGGAMHVNVRNGFAYVAHQGDDRVGTSILDVSNPAAPKLVAQIDTPPGTHSHKVQVVDDLMVVNLERNFLEPDAATWAAGLALYDVSDPSSPKEVGTLPMPGKGVHRMTFWQQPYCLMSGSDHGISDQFMIIADLSDPATPQEIGRWWLPGMNTAAGEVPGWPQDRKYKHHHSIVRGDRAYGGWWDAGLVILDVSDMTSPRLVSHLPFDPATSAATHTALPVPGRDLLVVTDECLHDGPRAAAMEKRVRLVDIGDERNPVVVGMFPIPEGDYHDRPGRCGPHNLHEMRPGSFQSSRTIHSTYFNAGLRVFDIEDPTAPQEVGVFVPPPAPGASSLQFNDLTVAEDGLIYVTDRAGGGLYIVEPEVGFA